MNKNQHIPQGYKSSPLGIIPEDWEVKRLGEIAEITSGTTPLRANRSYYDGGTIPWVKTTDLNNKELFDTEEYVSEIAVSKTSLKLLPKGTVLVAMYGGFNQIGRTSILGIEATINQALSALICNDKVLNFYVLAWLNGRVDDWKNLAASSRKDPNITGKDVEHFHILVPKKEEQQRIVSVLQLWDTAIEKQTQLVEKLTLRKRGLMQQLLTGKKRLKGFEGEWKTIELGDVLSYIQPTKYLVVSENYNDTYNTPVLTAGKTFILGYTNETTGVFDDLPAIIFDDFTTESKYVTFPFKAKSSAMKILKAHNSNLYFIFCAMQMIKYSIGGHERHWISKYSHLTLKVPSIEEQNAIASVLIQADQEIEIQKQKLARLQEQKKGLMQVLLTGKRRVK